MTTEDYMGALERLQSLLISAATSGQRDELAEEYRSLRTVLTREPALKEQLPEFLRNCRDIDAFWDCVKQPRFHHYHERRTFIRESLQPVFLWLEGRPSSYSGPPHKLPLTPQEQAVRQEIEAFLDIASEDQLTELLLVPLFQKLGFHRVSAAGHTEKTMEFGKDLWMKYQLPSTHWIYFGAQIKRDKIDSRGASTSGNIATILNQARMAIDHPVFDSETNREILIDHLYIIAGGDITRAARAWLIKQLDQSQRRHIIFMDRAELLDHSARIAELNLPKLSP